MKKYGFLLLLLTTLFAGRVTGQTTDTGATPMQGVLKEVEIRDPLLKWKSDYAENRILYKKELRYATLKPLRKPLVKIGEVGATLHDFWSVLALKATGKQKKFRRFKVEMERNETEDLAAIRYNTTTVSRLTGLEEPAAQAFIKQHPMSLEFLMSATDLELLQWIRDRYRAQ